MTNRALRIGMRVLLALSLLLNAVALAVVLRLGDLRTAAGLDGAALPREVRAAVIDSARNDPELLAALRALGPPRRALLQAAETAPFDRAAAEAAMIEVRKATTAAQVEAQRIILDALSARAAARGDTP